MANLTKNEKYIVDMYVRYFGKAPSVAEIAKYSEFGKPKLILKEIIGDADDSKAGLTTEEFVNNAFQNLFGRDATTKEMNKYSKVVDKGKDLPINAIVKAAKKSDKGVYDAKKAIAIMLAEKEITTNYNLDKITKDTYQEVYNLKTKKVLVDSVAQLQTKIDAMPDNVSGTTFNLTTGVDTLVGTEKSDLFNANNTTLTALDSIDGGLGNDTLNILAAAALDTTTIAGLEVKNVETVTIKGALAVKADTTSWTGTNTLNVTKATTVDVDAATTTDVNVSGATGATIVVDGGKNVDIKAAGNAVTSKGAAGTVTVTDAGKAAAATTIVVENGTDVTVNATTDTTGTIKVGDTTAFAAAKAATGNVEVNSTFTALAATDDAANAISVDGGKTITVNQMVTSSDTVLANTTGQTITQGAVVITGQDTTTTVTVKQEKSTAENAAVVAVAEKLSTSTVTFKGMASGQSVTVNGLTFTASKALTAAEVAAAFANLEIGDTQVNSGPTANGIFTGVNGTAGTAIWTSGTVTNVDATTSTVTYSANVAGAATALVVANSGAPVPVASAPTVGVLAVDAEAGVTGIANGVVTITDGGIDSIKTITVDGYAESTINANLLETLTLANSGSQTTGTAGDKDATMTVTTTSTGSLTLNLDNVNGDVSLDGGGASLTGLNITTTGEASDFKLTAAKVETLTIAAAADLDLNNASVLSALKTATITGAGDVTLGDVSGTLETLTASAATGAISATVDGDKATVTTGSGNDVITVDTATVTKAITLGAGDDRLDLSALTTVNATTTAAIAGGAGSDTVVLTAANAAVANLSSVANSAIFKDKVTGFEKLEIANAITAATTVNVGNLGYNYVITAADNTHDLTLADMANNGTVELNAAESASADEVIVQVKDAATNNADVLNVVLNVNGDVDNGTLTVANVETINITATDSTPVNTTTGAATINTSDFILAATSAKTVTITGNAHLDLDMTGNTAATLIDASTMTGDLTVTAYNAGMTVKGGAGNDTLIVDGAISGVVLTGGAGTDKFDVSQFDSLGNAGSAVTITDLTAGETIQFANANKFVSSKVTLIAESTLTEYVAEAAKVAKDAGAGNNISWFQFNNNTFAVQDMDGSGTFNTGDIIVKINGVKDLSTASFNATDDTLVIA